MDVAWLVKNVTYREHCYVCFTDDQSVRFVFSSHQPKPVPRCSDWMLLETVRAKIDNTTDFDNRFEMITIIVLLANMRFELIKCSFAIWRFGKAWNLMLLFSRSG